MGDERHRPLTRYEFDLWREGQTEWRAGQEKRVRSLERWRDAHEQAHETDDQEQQQDERERRRWSWQAIAVAVISAAGVVTAAAVQVWGRR